MLENADDFASVQHALTQYEALRRPRTSMVQAEARKNGMRYDSMYKDLAQRDKEIANSALFRKSLYDYDIEAEALNFKVAN
jgi:salicylate hydroxylase